MERTAVESVHGGLVVALDQDCRAYRAEIKALTSQCRRLEEAARAQRRHEQQAAKQQSKPRHQQRRATGSGSSRKSRVRSASPDLGDAPVKTLFSKEEEGEGVDDYGGPYRECFAQLTFEVQATETRTVHGDTRERCILPLLIPAPNRHAKVGDNRERYYLSPSACRQRPPRAHLNLHAT